MTDAGHIHRRETMSIWPNQAAYRGISGDVAKFAVFAEGAESRICIRAYDRVAEESAVIAMTPDQAAEFARDLLDAALSMQEEQDEA